MNRRTLIEAIGAGGAGLLGLAAATPASAQDAARERRLREDWPWLGRYAADNAALKAAGTPVDIVFMGDSITEGWRDKRPGFFRAGRVCRGISGQTRGDPGRPGSTTRPRSPPPRARCGRAWRMTACTRQRRGTRR